MSLQFRAFVLIRKMDLRVAVTTHAWPGRSIVEMDSVRASKRRTLPWGVRGLRVEIEMDQLKHHIGSGFVITSPPRWMVAAAVRANSCPPEKIRKNKLHEGGGQGGVNHTRLVRGCAISGLKWRSAGGIRNRFYWNAHPLRGLFQGCQEGFLKGGQNLGVRCCQV